MKLFLYRLWRALLLLLQFIWRYVLQPLFYYGRQWGLQFYRQHEHKLTAAYWQQLFSRIRHYNWSTARLQDFRFLWRGAWRFGLMLLLGFFVLYLAVYLGLLGGMPSKSELKARQNHTASEVYSADSVLLGRYYIQDRTNVRFQDIAPAAVEALIATEDARFYDHYGIDPRSLLRVFFKTLLFQDESSGGGSTISQQLAKNLYPRRHYWLLRTPINKLREYIIAVRLEQVYSKEEILELYLNTVPMGGNLYGIERSARRFFNTSADSLKTEQAAVLIGMLKATTTYNPRLDLEKSRQRRNVVLGQMVKYGYLSAAKAEALQNLPLKLNYWVETHNDGLAPYFREQLRLELAQWVATQQKENGEPYNLYTDGLKIYTTIHAGLQRQAERAVRRRMARLQSQFDAHWQGRTPWGNNADVIQVAMHQSDRYKKLKAAGKSEEEIEEAFRQSREMSVFSWKGNAKRNMSPMDSLRHYARFLNAGLLSVEPGTGYVRAWVGGINHAVFKYDHVRSKRQVGSTFKPIVYAAALERGMEPCAYFPNQRLSYPDYDNWSPRNANNQYGGEYSMAGALAYSVNTVSAQILMQTGIAPTIGLARRLGVQSELPEVPSLALGTAALSLFEMVGAYATFASDGYYTKPVYVLRVVDRSGKTLLKHQPEAGARQALAYENAATMVRLMQQVVEEGSAGRLRSEFGLQMDIAGKTGTTQDHTDGWFIGMTPDLVTGVWVGAEDPAVRFRTLTLGQGANTALPVWGEFMALATRTPDFTAWRYNRFRPLPHELQYRLACTGFVEQQPVEEPDEREGSFLERLFDRLEGKHRDREKDRDRDEWKKEEKWHEERKKDEEKRRERRKKDEEKWREERKKEEEKQREEWKKQRERDRERWKDN